ncbi:hypothetical protein BGW41_001321 [Actinomortierella wolfii]|nr:hypothetical protein BGW41_001321 [Actinomortierella wolfii]
MVAARARWIISKIQRTYRESMERLEWLQKEIEAFERAEERGAQTDRRDGSQSGSSATDDSNSTATSSTSSNSTPDLADRTGRHYVLKNPGIQMLGPDLFTMDLEAFLRDPQERRRILRLEAKAMRTDLRLMRKQVIDQSKKAATQAIQ